MTGSDAPGGPADQRRAAGGSGTVGAVLTLTGLTIWAIVLAVLCVFGPKLERVFADFGVALPLTTRMSIGMSRWLTGRGVGHTFPGIAVAAPVLLGVTFGFLCGRRFWALALLFMLAGITALTTLCIANLLPLVSLVESLQKAN